MSDGADEDTELSHALHAQIFELWIEPELSRRAWDRLPVRRALVLMSSIPPTVLLNEEFDAVATVRATRAIEAGDRVTISDFSEVSWVQPDGVDPNAGWILYAVIGADAYVTFDLRSNVARAVELTDRAEEFAEAAREAVGREQMAAAADLALSAAELAVKAELYLLGDDSRHGHQRRLEFWAQWVQHGNAPPHLADTFAVLTRERARARYCDGALTLDVRQLSEIVAEVADMVALAREHATGRDYTFRAIAG
jgi:HEPN domain-containing protein